MRIDESRKQALIVLGMHRSGTSAATRVLSLLGARLPGGMLPADQNNESGYWESAAVVELHDEVLASVGSSWDDVSPFPESWFRSQAAKDFQSRVVEILEREYEDSPLFVLKDPRISRFVPFWISVLKGFKAEPSFVITVRNPLEVAASLKSREGFSLSHSLLLWLRHVLEAELQTRQSQRTVLFYEDLLSDPIQAMTKVAEDIGIHWPQSLHDAKAQIDAFLVQQYRHHVFEADELKAREDVSRWVKQAYKLLRKADDSNDLALRFDTIREELEVADRAFGPLLADSQLKVSELRGEIEHLSQELTARETNIGRLGVREAAREELLTARQQEIERLHKELAAREAEVRRLTVDLTGQAEQRELLAVRLQDHVAQVEQLDRALWREKGRIVSLERQVEQASGLLQTRDDELRQAAADLDESRHTVKALHQSWSWRLTAPLRAVVDLGLRIQRG